MTGHFDTDVTELIFVLIVSSVSEGRVMDEVTRMVLEAVKAAGKGGATAAEIGAKVGMDKYDVIPVCQALWKAKKVDRSFREGTNLYVFVAVEEW
jgi:hypothetical protein